MGLDTKYRPNTYDDVLGQEATKKVLRRLVETQKGFHQSYLFAGPYGSGKTTLGRILARALLCDNPNGGDPCDQCLSCQSILNGSSESFVEFDAATNSGKAEIKKITEEIQYTTFSGKRRIYLMDESHRLSRDALDALLKPLEEDVPGTREKRLICIFCTTEPEKMRSTVLSRCAPTFVIEPVSPSIIAQRLAWVCDQEGIAYDLSSLEVLAEVAECHIRDALKSVEGISMLGSIDQNNVNSYLHLSINDLYIQILIYLGDQQDKALLLLDEVLKRVSPTTVYEKLSNLCLLAYQYKVGAVKNIPSYWKKESIKDLSDLYGDQLVDFSARFSERPSRVSKNTLICDLATLLRVSQPISSVSVLSDGNRINLIREKYKNGTIKLGDGSVTSDGTYVDLRAAKEHTEQSQDCFTESDEISPSQFWQLVVLEVEELERQTANGSKRSENLDCPGTFPSGGDQSDGGES